MSRPLARSSIVLLAVCLLILGSPATFADDDNLEALNQRIVELFEQGKYQEAIPLAEKAVEIARRLRRPEDPKFATSLNNLAVLYDDMGDYAKAEPLYQQALRIRQKVLGPEHPSTATSLNNLAALYKEMGEYPKAEPLYQQALRINPFEDIFVRLRTATFGVFRHLQPV